MKKLVLAAMIAIATTVTAAPAHALLWQNMPMSMNVQYDPWSYSGVAGWVSDMMSPYGWMGTDFVTVP